MAGSYNFRHPALAAAAGNVAVQQLQLAGNVVGASDPIEAMKLIDCAPSQLSPYADCLDADSGGAPAQPDGGSGHSSTVSDQVADARADFDGGRGIAEQSWRGPAADQFVATADGVSDDYTTVKEKVDKSAQALRTIAGALDSLATHSADETVSIAQQAQPASDRILSGGSDPLDQATVTAACDNVESTVTSDVDQIPDKATSQLDGLTQPALGRDGGTTGTGGTGGTGGTTQDGQ